MKTIINKDNVLAEIEKELNKINLCDYATQQIIQELDLKSFNIQATFYYKTIGYNNTEVAYLLKVDEKSIRYYLSHHLNNIKVFLEKRSEL